MKAELLETCNCQMFACPCNYTAIPSDGTCKSVTAYREGAFGKTRLDGLMIGNLWVWPNAIHEGNGRARHVIDERADETQRDAIAKIVKGEAGEGGPWAIFATTLSEPPQVLYGAIAFEREGRSGRFSFAELGGAELEPILSEFDESEADVHWVLPGGFIWTDGEVVRATAGEAKTDGISFRYESSWGVIADVAYNVLYDRHGTDPATLAGRRLPQRAGRDRGPAPRRRARHVDRHGRANGRHGRRSRHRPRRARLVRRRLGDDDGLR